MSACLNALGGLLLESEESKRTTGCLSRILERQASLEAGARVDLSSYLGKLYVPMKGDFNKKFGPFEDHESLQSFDP